MAKTINLFTEEFVPASAGGLAGDPASQAGSSPRACRWLPADLTGAAGLAPPAADNENGAGDAAIPPLLFTEDEVARLCAAAVTAGRFHSLAEERRRWQSQISQLANELKTQLSSLWREQARLLHEAREKAGELLAEAFAHLAPEVLQSSQKIQLARDIASVLPLFAGMSKVRIRVAGEGAELLAAALQAQAGEGVELEVLQDPTLAPGGFRLECGETELACDPAELVDRIASALRRTLRVSEAAPR